MRSRLVRLWVCLPLLLLFQPAFAEYLPVGYRISNATYDVVYKAREELDDSTEHTITLNVTNRLDGEEKRIELSVWLLEMEFISDRLLFLVNDISSANGVSLTVVDLAAGKKVENFFSHQYQLSPSKRYLVYASWYPKMAAAQDRKSFLMLYDFERIKDPKPIQNGFDNYPPKTTGWGLYPETFLRVKKKILVDGEWGYVSPFLFSKDEKKIVFVLYDHDRIENNLLYIDISEGYERPKTFRKTFGPDRRVLSETSGNTAIFITGKLEWMDETHVLVEYYDKRVYPDPFVLSLNGLKQVN